MAQLQIGDLIQFGPGRQGIVLEPAPAPHPAWLARQDDVRLRSAAGPWWNVVALDGGGALVAGELAVVLQRATVDDVLTVLRRDTTQQGLSTLHRLFSGLLARGGARQQG